MNNNNRFATRTTNYALVAIITLTYAGIFLYPYLRADDTFLVYTWLKFRMFDTGMGRPVFWYLNDINSFLFTIIGRESILVFRIVGLGAIVGTALLWHKWFLKWQVKSPQAFAATVGIFMLPSYQIVIGNGCWLAPGVFLGIFAGIKLFDLAYIGKLRHWKTYLYSSLILLCFATYQILGFLPGLVALVPLIWERDANYLEIQKRFLATIKLLIIIGITFALYYFLWQIALKIIPPSVGGIGYLPTQKNWFLKNIMAAFYLLGAVADINWPIGVITNLWRIEYHFDLISGIFVFLVGLGLFDLGYRRSFKSAFWKISGITLVIFSQYCLFWLLDKKYQMGRYTTIIGVVSGLSLLAIKGIEIIFHVVSKKHADNVWLALALILALGTSYNFNRYVIFPSIVENLETKMQLASFDPKKHDGIIVKLVPQIGDSSASREFIFNNQTPGYAWHMLRSYLKERGLAENIPIRIVDAQGLVLNDFNTASTKISSSSRMYTIDFLALPIR